MPTRKTLCSKLLPERYTVIEEEIKSKLQKVSTVFLTVDLWSSRGLS